MPSWLIDWTAPLQNLALGATALALIFVPLERAFRARSQRHFRPELRLDLAFMALQYLVVATATLSFNALLQGELGSVLPATVQHRVERLPPLVQVGLVVVLGDLVLYWGHRLSHSVPLLWRFHAIHHSAKQLDWVAAHREHPLDGLYSQLCFNAPAFLLGINVALLVPVLVVRGAWAVFIHSNVRIPLGPLGLLLGDPTLHRFHHVGEPDQTANYANLAPYLDVLFGTHVRPAGEDYELGVRHPMPNTLLGCLVAPFWPGWRSPR